MGTNNDTGRRRSRVAKKQQEAEKTQAAAQTTPATKRNSLQLPRRSALPRKRKKEKRNIYFLRYLQFWSAWASSAA